MINYRGNVNLKRKGVKIEWTPELLEEYRKCADDPIYFAENYIKIVHPDDGFKLIDFYDFQKDIIKTFNSSRNLAVATSRQVGKCLKNDTEIQIRNKKTGEIYKTTLEEVFNNAKENMQKMQ